MPFPAQSTLGWHVCISILHVTAITSTLLRLVHRWRRLYLWWDDWATILPLICDVLYFAIMWLTIQHKLMGSLFTSFWFGNILFLTIVWLSRASLALSIARIFPARHICRRISYVLTGVFVFLWIACILMSALECYDGSAPEWWNVPLPLCVAKRPSVKGGIYLAIAFDFLADIFLIGFPILVLWSVKIPVVERRLVFALFSCSILTLMSSVFFGTLGLLPLRSLGPDAFLLLDMGGQLQASISIIVCNIMVLATLVYRVGKKKLAPEIESLPRKEPPVPMVPATADRRGTSVFRDAQLQPVVQNFQPRIEGQNGTIMTADPVFSANSTHPLPASGSPPSNTDSQQTNTNSKPASNLGSQQTESNSEQTTSSSQQTDSKSQGVDLNSRVVPSDPQYTNSRSEYTNSDSRYINSNSQYVSTDSQYTSQFYGTSIDPYEDPQLDSRTTAPVWSFPETQASSSIIMNGSSQPS